MEIGKEVRDLSQGPKNVYFVDTARKSLLECSYFLCLSKECKDYNYLIAINYVFVSVAWQALTMQILFKLNFMIAIYILGNTQFFNVVYCKVSMDSKYF